MLGDKIDKMQLEKVGALTPLPTKWRPFMATGFRNDAFAAQSLQQAVSLIFPEFVNKILVKNVFWDSFVLNTATGIYEATNLYDVRAEILPINGAIMETMSPIDVVAPSSSLSQQMIIPSTAIDLNIPFDVNVIGLAATIQFKINTYLSMAFANHESNLRLSIVGLYL